MNLLKEPIFRGFTMLKIKAIENGVSVNKRMWIYGLLLHNNNIPNGRYYYIQLEYDHTKEYMVAMHSVGMYTGKQDVNGNMLFSNDIVKYWGGIGRIFYSDIYAGFRIWYDSYNSYDIPFDCERIGNTYENKNLLK